MRISPSRHRNIRFQNLIFTILFLIVIGLLGWLSNRYTIQFDWTNGGRNSLSEASEAVVKQMDGPVSITAFAFENKVTRSKISDFIGRYQRHKKEINLTFINPDKQPEKVRELGITIDGELIVEFNNRSEKVKNLTEALLTNALQRLSNKQKRWVVFLTGHGERNPFGQANHDLEQFGKTLTSKGISVQRINLVEATAIPDNSALLVIASPQIALLDGEVKLIEDYVQQGGNLLWLQDPGDLHNLYSLAERLGIEFLPGTIVDASTQLLGIDDPSFALVSRYPLHPITQDFQSLTLFPVASALEKGEGESDFQSQPLLSTLERSWTETGLREGEIEFDPDSEETRGPLDLGFALTRTLDENNGSKGESPKEQRIIVIGDGDFISNSFIGNGANLDLGLNIVQWLNEDDQFLNIPARTAPDLSLNLSETSSAVIGLGFLFVLPIILIGSGAFIWLRRRKR
ncbi:MAG: ABC transporter [Gammaproteobacteria bacterium]|nr:MAG: ABC transporter [Gammaproteobacteria bacterium]RLA23528.1 MAG: ABC transporter [Gammaproteobacteria bacterium]